MTSPTRTDLANRRTLRFLLGVLVLLYAVAILGVVVLN
ncbi:MAG: hypothetical protein KatS3mg076_0335 [Candidatus Binatia bacterium]|nr:MAG: hypothetical protein KatS3mg076_0335 [Candidatus Binatia bacterium]